MGVRRLQYFMEFCCPGGCRKVSIRELASEYVSKRKVQPVLAIDGMSCTKNLYGDLCWLMSGQWREFIEKMKTFVEFLHSMSIIPVFFFDGDVIGTNRSNWVQRQLRTAKDVETVFDLFRQSASELRSHNMYQKAASIGTFACYALKYECGCDVRTTISDLNVELSTFVRENNCLALLGDDSDFIVTSCVPYLMATSLNSQLMTVTLIDREALTRDLKLRVEQLPLLACLCGNDIIPENSLIRFHREIRIVSQSPSVRHVLVRLAEFVRSHPCHDVDDCLSSIADVVFSSKVQADLLRKALETYSLRNSSTHTASEDSHKDSLETAGPTHQVPCHNPCIMEMARSKHVLCESPRNMYSIMCGHEYESNTALEDQSVKDLPQCALLYKPLRQRVYSLLFEKSSTSPQQTVTVREWCVYAENKLDEPDYVEPISLKMSGGTPSLEDLWLGGSEVDRWGAFLACVSATFNQEVVANVAPHFIVFCCIINYLVQFTNIEAWEVEAFVAQAVSPIAQNLSRLSQVKLSRLDLRAIQLATIFMRGVTSVQMALGACGHPVSFHASMPWHFFDGKLFHECYILAKNGTPPFGLCDNEAAVLEQFHQLMGVIVFKTRLADWSFW